MKRRKILCAILMLCLMVVTVGCGKKITTNPTSNERKLTYWAVMPPAMSSQVSSFSHLPIYKQLEKKLGVKLEFINPSADQQAEKFNLMLASGNMADIVESYWHGVAGGVGKAISDGTILRLNDLIEKNSPNFSKLLKENPAYAKECKIDDGSYFGYPQFNQISGPRVFGGIMLRGDWLSDLGLSVPETIDELETVLKAFKEKKGAKAPYVTKSELIAPGSGQYPFGSAFNIGTGIYVQNGKVKYAPLEPGYKELVTMLRRWYAEGLLDKDFANNNDTAIDAKMTNGQSGACYGFVGGTIGKYMAAMKDKDPKYSLVGMQFPVKNKGDIPNVIPVSAAVSPPYAAITKSCENPELAAQVMDFFYSEEGSMMKTFGIEGENYNMVNGVPTYTDEILKNPKGLSMAEAISKYNRVVNPAPGLVPSKYIDSYYGQYYTLKAQKDAYLLWSKYGEDPNKNIAMPMAIEYNPKDADEMSSIQFELYNYVLSSLIKFVQGTEPMENYGNFVQQMKSMKAERLVSISQEALDRYLKR